MNCPRPITVCFPFTGDTVGGSHISVLGLLKSLDRSRFKPLIVVQKPGGRIAGLFEDAGFEVESPFDWQGLPFDKRVGLRQLAGTMRDLGPKIRYLRDRGVDIVHSNDGRTHATWGLATRLAGCKLLWHHRGDPNAKGLRLAAPLLANKVLTVSEFSRPRPGIYSAAHKAQVVHSPFDTSISVDRAAMRARLLDELGARSDTFLVGYFGLFVDRKRPLLFLEAVAELAARAKVRPVRGLMFGKAIDADMDQAISKRIEELELTETVSLMGFRSPGADWIAACDALMVPAVQEPFGRTLVEAMLVGTPIVATRSGGNIEALRDGELGELVEPENPSVLAEACIRLMENPVAAQDVAETAMLDARRRFSERHHGERVMRVYAELAANVSAMAAA
jgi:glycosyltransferase involved in cell wall biosynthesis